MDGQCTQTMQSTLSMHEHHGTCTCAGHGTHVALVHMAFLTLSFAGCDVQDPHPCAHGMTGTCNMLGTRIPPAWLTAACSRLLGKGSLALAPRQCCRAAAGAGSPGSAALPWHSAGPGWSSLGSAKHPGRSQWSAGTKGALAADTVQAVGKEGRSRQGGAGQRMGGCRILSRTPGYLPGAALPGPSRVHLPVHWAAQGRCCLLLTLTLRARYRLLLCLLWKGMGGWI